MEIATIGFTRTSAESFFGRIADSGIKRLGDVRVHNTSQLAGFAKKDDLAYFLRVICRVEYVELPELATAPELLTAWRSKQISWPEYEKRYAAVLRERKVEASLDRSLFEPGIILLCSEDTAEHCHRRLAAEYLQTRWPDVKIRHL